MKSVNETYTFNETSGNFQFTVKREFLQEVPEPEKMDVQQLFGETQMPKFLHNPVGPAIKHLKIKNNEIEDCYFLNGTPLTKEETEKLIHNQDFSQGFEKLIKD
jgi:predicted PilT family ATPase